MASLLVDLHRGGVYWGDCSLANTLFRRDGDRIQAYLVDAETSEVHPTLSDGQRAYDLEVLVENVAFGLADLAAYNARDLPDELRRGDRARPRASGPATGSSGTSSTPSSELGAGRPIRRGGAGPPPERPWLRGRRDRARAGRAAAAGCGSGSRSRPAASTPASSSGCTGIRALEGQARILHERPARVPRLARVVRAAAGSSVRRPPRAGSTMSTEPTIARLRRRGRSGSRPRPGLLRRARAQVAALRAGRPRCRPGGGHRSRTSRSARRLPRSRRTRRPSPEIEGLGAGRS